MARIGTKLVLAVAVVASLAACNRNDRTPELMNIRSSGPGPDEFAIVPNRPLEPPEDFTALPTPTPGGPNLVDPNPEADAIAALGGRPAAASTGGVPTADSALVSRASRFGVAPGIRQTLAQEDLDFRRRRDGRLMERVFNVNVYYRAYRPMSLNQYAELERLRALGVRTPAAPPAPQ